MKDNKQTTQIFGYDVGQMPAYAQVGYIAAVIIFFAVVFKVLSGMLFEKESNPMNSRREEIRKRKEKKGK